MGKLREIRELQLLRTVAVAIAFVCLSFSQCFASPPAESVELPPGFSIKVFHDESGDHRYGVYLPNDYSPDKAWPVVLFLHGAGEKGTDGYQPLSVGLGVALEEHPNLPFIAVFPQCESERSRHLTAWLANSPDADRALKILKEVESEYSIDPSRRTLCGWSMGGYGAWSLAADSPELWQGVMALSGGETENGLDLKSLANSKIPVWAIHGSNDELISSDFSAELVRKLSEAGGSAELSVVENAGHDVWRIAFANPDVLNWLTDPSIENVVKLESTAETAKLPIMANFYEQSLMTQVTLADKLALRLGNEALASISDGISEFLPRSALRGELPDIEREFKSSSGTVHVLFSDIAFDGNLEKCELHAISGGRFRADFDLSPLLLTIKEAQLRFSDESATTGEFHVNLGHQHPVRLSVEFQPTVTPSGLKLLPLRQEFQIADHNWHISKPVVTHLDSETFSEANIITGLVGGLYLRKNELEEAVLGVVPTMLEVVQGELQTRNAPRLARLLWPLPALVPILSVSPSQVRTDSRGVSIVFDMEVLTHRSSKIPTDFSTQGNQLTVNDVGKKSHLDFLITLDALKALAQLAIADGLAYINVLDIQDARFAELADRQTLQKIFSGFEAVSRPSPTALENESSPAWDVGLRLIEPFSVHSPEQDREQDSTIITLTIPRASFEVALRDSKTAGTIEFSMQQQLRLSTIRSENRLESLQVEWIANPAIEVLDSTWNGSVDEQQFRTILADVWTDWTSRKLDNTRPLPTLQFGSSQLQLELFSIQENEVRLQFLNATSSPPVQASSSSPSDAQP
ncbi:Alpha/beta hydrolase family protein [Thalassoglobus neptunius]|uniref:Alpha/beta hydrolase family protein n=1 Tax=Thalassoglobus neptunius TaxID=1938619 RepID=A0A5C5WQJ9_9PLAN|nr:alpha/beta hydrolase-fold protein [Thalassoglobus neptunius]TWT52323.1 Alpha/beta hydrolase family protein [Thalassoglobus neptunius]